MNKELENQKNHGDSKKIVSIFVVVATLLISVTGATYAWFAISASNTTAIQGTTANISTTLTVDPVLPASGATSTGVMVPQYSAVNSKNALKQAIDGGCIDGNKNIVCKVYKISFQNKSSSGMTSKATLTLTSTMSNLKWYTLATGNNVASVPSTTTYTYPGTLTAAYGNAQSVTLLGAHINPPSGTIEPNKYRYWYVVVWVEESGNNQYNADGNKSFTGTVQLDATDSAGNVTGLTSTFTGA